MQEIKYLNNGNNDDDDENDDADVGDLKEMFMQKLQFITSAVSRFDFFSFLFPRTFSHVFTLTYRSNVSE